MKTNAIIRIVCYSLVVLLLTGILLTGLGIGSLVFSIGSDPGYTSGQGSIDAEGVSDLEIEWAAGSITIQTGDTDQITFTESGNFEEKDAMAYKLQGDTLHISYSKANIQIGFVSLSEKDLVITVPQDWFCEKLELDGASLDMQITGLSIGTLDIDGAANSISVTGAVETLECDGASCEVTLVCTGRPGSIDLDGAACSLDLILPKDCGFQLQMDGLNCDFDSDLAYTGSNGNYIYGDRHTKINADGISCEITIQQTS